MPCGWAWERRQGSWGRPLRFRRVLELARRVAPSDVTVLLRGESGTGKERVARLLHSLSPRHSGPFVPLNCAAVPETLLEAELFGIERGVATGVTARPGRFELANGGTLFLDEIADLTPVLQAKLLRVVQDREVERVGGRQRMRVDVRLVTATNRDLEVMMAQGEFRQDLYYRLRVVELTIPPLRERHEDIPLLAQHFVRLQGRRLGREKLSLSRGALELLLQHDFPGNVRELENLLEAATALAAGDRVEAEDLRLAMGAGTASADLSSGTLDEVLRSHVLRTLDRCQGSRTAAAHALGIDRTTLYRMLLRWNATTVAKSNAPEKSTSQERPEPEGPSVRRHLMLHCATGRIGAEPPAFLCIVFPFSYLPSFGRELAPRTGHGAPLVRKRPGESVPGTALPPLGGGGWGGRRRGRALGRHARAWRSPGPSSARSPAVAVNSKRTWR